MLVELDAAERQQVIDQPAHARGLLAHDGKEALARLRVILCVAPQRVDEAGQRGQGRAQFVAGIGNEIRPHLLDALRLRRVLKQQQHRTNHAVSAINRQDLGVEKLIRCSHERERHALAAPPRERKLERRKHLGGTDDAR